MSNWALAAALGRIAAGTAGKAIMGSRVGRGMVGGALVGGFYGAVADDSSLLGGAFRGGMAGLTIGGVRKGLPMIGAAAGALYGGLGRGNALTGALMGAGMGYGALGLSRAARAGYLGYASGGWRGAGRGAFLQARGDAVASGRYIGRTARNAYGRIRGIFV